MKRTRTKKPHAPDLRAVRALWFAFSLLATYVSLYPGNFVVPAHLSGELQAFLGSCCGRLSRGDVLGNVVLFVPFGFLGMLAGRPSQAPIPRIVYVAVVAVLFALALQVLQLFLPGRDENLQDVFWNLVGTGVGIPLGLAAQRHAPRLDADGEPLAVAPLLLVAAWLAYRLMPFVPSIDLQVIRDSLKPLLLYPDLSLAGVAHDTAAWLTAAWLLRLGLRRSNDELYLPVLVALVLFAEVLIVGNTVSAANALGAILGLGLWFGWLRRAQRPEPAIAFLLLGGIVLWGLAPFEARGFRESMNWLPFGGFLGGSMAINAQSAAEKFFLYGGAVFALWRSGTPRWLAVAVVALLVLAIEIAQMFFAGRSPEITDPFLVVICALALAAFDRAPRPPPRRPTRHHRHGASRRRRRSAPPPVSGPTIADRLGGQR